MKYRPFGKTGLNVSEIGFGAWGIGGTWWSQKPDDNAARETLRLAIDLGINFFDTALVYGNGHSEQLVGRILREKKASTHVASKIPPKNFQWPAAHNIPSKETFPSDWIIQNTEKSLKNLRVEQLDLIQFHVWSDSWMAEEEWWTAVERLKKDGKIRFWGVSINDHEPDSALKLVGSGRADSVQVIYNIFDQTPTERLFPLCQEKKVAVIVRVPLDEGSLTGTFSSKTTFEEGDFRQNYFKNSRLAETVQRVSRLKFLLDEGVDTLAQAALKFCLSHPAVSTVIPGMRKPDRVRENVRTSDGQPFSPTILARLKEHAWSRNFYRD